MGDVLDKVDISRYVQQKHILKRQVMPIQARLDAPGTLHHVIVRGIERRKIVDDDQDRDDFVSRIGLIASETRMSIYAWVLMTQPCTHSFTDRPERFTPIYETISDGLCHFL